MSRPTAEKGTPQMKVHNGSRLGMTAVTQIQKRAGAFALAVTLCFGLMPAMALAATTASSGDAVLREVSQEPTPGAAPCPSVSPTPGTPPQTEPLTCLAIQSLSPTNVTSSVAKVSDMPDGVNETFDLTAVVSQAPSDAVVDAFLIGTSSERLIARLTKVPGTTDTWEHSWDVPDTLDIGNATIEFRVAQPAAEGPVVLAKDRVTANLQHKDGPPPPATNPLGSATLRADTAELTWPLQGGPLGFFKPIGGSWVTVVEGLSSANATASNAFTLYYSVSPIGADPVFVSCGTGNTTARPADDIRPFKAACTLGKDDIPSKVTAVAVIPKRQDAGTPTPAPADQSGDVHRVLPYVQKEADMSISLEPVAPAAASTTMSWPSGSRRTGGACLDVDAIVEDGLGRPVQGAQVDVQLTGPGDAVAFGTGAGTFKAPDGMTEQEASTCSAAATVKQGIVGDPAGPDIKRIESLDGTGSQTYGTWRFKVFSPTTEWGWSTVTAWVDELPRAAEAGDPAADNDIRDAAEPSVETKLQWLEKAVTLKVVPRVDVAPLHSCHPYDVVIKSGEASLPGANVDLHVQAPNLDLEFCEVPGSSVVFRAPDAGAHGTEEAPGGDQHSPPSSPCPVNTAACYHLEGEVDDAGKLVFGLTSHTAGLSTVRAWLDGDVPADNDVKDSGETSVDIVTSWVGSATDAKLGFVNPTTGTLPTSPISSDKQRIVVAVDAPYVVDGVELTLTSSAGSVSLGEARPVHGGSIYTLEWDLTDSPLPGGTNGPVPEGTGYSLKARINDTGVSAEVTGIAVNRTQELPNETAAPPEWVRISTPGAGDGAVVQDGKIKVAGTASPGSEGVDLFYSTTPNGQAATWSACSATPASYADLSGSGSEAQEFAGTCTLPATVAPLDVTGVGARVYDCLVAGCDATPANRLPSGGALEGVDAVTFVACEGDPCIVVLPSEWQSSTNECIAVEAQVVSIDGGVPNYAVGAALEGSEDLSFCTPEKEPDPEPTTSPSPSGSPSPSASPSASSSAPPDGPTSPPVQLEGDQQLVGRTDATGTLRMGVRSSVSSFESKFSTTESIFTSLTAWLDTDANGTQEPSRDPFEARSDRTMLHWTLDGRCTMVGTSGDDVLVATAYPNKICGRGGNDVITGLNGAEGNDIILGGPGNDTILGEKGNDLIFGGPGRDVLYGSDGDDRLIGGAGIDELFGDLGSDQLNGGKARDGCTGGPKGAPKKEKDTLKSCERAARKPPEEETTP